MVSERKKASNARWDRENMTSLTCKVRRIYADKIKKVCKENGTTPSAVMRQALDDFVREKTTQTDSYIDD